MNQLFSRILRIFHILHRYSFVFQSKAIWSMQFITIGKKSRSAVQIIEYIAYRNVVIKGNRLFETIYLKL